MRFRHDPPAARGTAVSGLDLVFMRASTDADFRRSLLPAPRANFGIQLPPTLRLRFEEKADDADIHVVLPALAPAHLSDEQLQSVGGGYDPGAAGWLARVHAI